MKALLISLLISVSFISCGPMTEFIPTNYSSQNQMYESFGNEPIKLFLSPVNAPAYHELGLIRVWSSVNDMQQAVKQARKIASEKNADCIVYKQFAISGGEHESFTYEFIAGKLIDEE